jgi:Flp pilus assembly protein TadB
VPTVLGPDAERRFGSRAVEAVQEVERSEPVPVPSKPRGRDLRQKSAKAAQTTGQVVRAINWQTLFSFRFLLGNLLIAAVIAILPSLLWPVLGSVVFFAAFAVLVVVGATNPELVLYCPHCKKRVKAGASACHHCGRTVA